LRYFYNVCSIGICTLLLLFPVTAQEIGFLFDPPDVTFTTTSETSTRQMMGSKSGMMTSLTVLTEHVLKQVDSTTYVIEVRPEKVTATNRGMESANPVLDIMYKTPYTLVLNQHGEATEVRGFDGAEQAIDSALSGPMAQRARQELAPDRLREEKKSEWNGLVGFRRSGAGSVGDIAYDVRNTQMMDGTTLDYYSAAQIVDTMTIDGQPCARMIVTACSQPEMLADSLNLTRDKILGIFALTEDMLAHYRDATWQIVSQVELVWEVNTGLLRSVASSKEIGRKVEAQGNVDMAMYHETQDVTYTYQERSGDS